MSGPVAHLAIAAHVPDFGALRALGIRVLPVWGIAPDGGCRCPKGKNCNCPGKHPCETGWQESASDDLTRLGEWAIKYPGTNWGAVTGTVLPDGRHWGVIDVDVKNNGLEDWAAIVRAGPGMEPVTPTVQTGSGGFHFYVAHRSPLPTGKLAKGIDFKAQGGLIVLPPSTHRSGNLYVSVLPATLPFVDLDQEILDRLRNWRIPKPPRLPADGVIPDGQRTLTMVSFAGTLLRVGLDGPSTHAALSSLNDRRFAPPMAATGLADLVASIDRLENQRRTKEGEEARRVGDLLAEGVPESALLIPSYGVTTGRPMLLSGPSASGKTTLAQDLAVNVAAGNLTCWGGVELKLAGPVVHVDYEQGQRETVHRYERIARGLGVDLGTLPVMFIAPRIHLDSRGARDVFRQLMRGRALLILDNLRAACPRMKENESGSRRTLDVLRELSEETGCLVLVLLHEGKPQYDGRGAPASRSPRGSSALVDAAGVVLSLGGSGKGKRTLRQIKAPVTEPGPVRDLFLESIDMQPSGYPRAVKLSSAPAEGASARTSAPRDLTGMRARVLAEVAKAPNLNMTALEDAVKGDATDRRTAIAELKKEGLLVVAKGARNARLFSLSAPLAGAVEQDRSAVG